MKKFVLLAAIACSSLAAMAQTDITPARYNFAAQEVGPYAFDEFITGANPAANYANFTEKFSDGYIVANNGQFSNENVVNRFKSGTNIVDLGGEIGKVLCIKGNKSTFEAGEGMSDVLPPAWFNLSFGLAPDSHEAGQAVRFHYVFALYRNVPDPTKEMLLFDAYTFGNWSYITNYLPSEDATEHDKEFGAKYWSSGDFIARYEDDGSPKEDEGGNMYYDNTIWQQVEYDFSAGDEAGVPLRSVIKWSNAKTPEVFDEYVLLIKELTATVDAQGDPETKPVKFEANPDALKSVLGNCVYGVNYDLQGRQVKNAKGLVIENGVKVIK